MANFYTLPNVYDRPGVDEAVLATVIAYNASMYGYCPPKTICMLWNESSWLWKDNICINLDKVPYITKRTCDLRATIYPQAYGNLMEVSFGSDIKAYMWEDTFNLDFGWGSTFVTKFN